MGDRGDIAGMKFVIIADIHGNLDALFAVLLDARKRGGFREIWCLGDIVGYGPEPHACIELLRQYKHICVAGNHDWAAIGSIDIADFNPYAAQAILWTREQLSDDDMDYLQKLPERITKGNFTLVHGSPRHPIWEYLDMDWLTAKDIEENFDSFNTRFCLVGHSHKPVVFKQDNSRHYSIIVNPHEIKLGPKSSKSSRRLIINPGGVGQPRDGNPEASYAIYDSRAQVVYHYRVGYNITATQQKMAEHNLPLSLIERLSYGY